MPFNAHYNCIVTIAIQDAKRKHNSYVLNLTNATHPVWKIVKNITARDQDEPFRAQDLDLEPDDTTEK